MFFVVRASEDHDIISHVYLFWCAFVLYTSVSYLIKTSNFRIRCYFVYFLGKSENYSTVLFGRNSIGMLPLHLRSHLWC